MTSLKYKVNFNLNTFFNTIRLKKQYLQQLKEKIRILKDLKEKKYKDLRPLVSYNPKFRNCLISSRFVMYIIDIKFSKTNTLLHVMDSLGKLKFFYSAGSFKFSGKQKKSRAIVFREFYKVLVSNLKFLSFKPIALHLKNVGRHKFWIVKKLKKKFYIKIVRNFNSFPHNGCRKKKKRRKKVKKTEGEMAERFKVADCKSVEFSHHRFKSCFLQVFLRLRNITQR